MQHTDTNKAFWRITTPAQHQWMLVALPTLVVALVHGPTLTNFLYTHDGWNDVQLGENILDGQIALHENLLRSIPTLSFAVRALFGLEMWAWHLPNILLHAFNAYLVAWLTYRLSQCRESSVMAGILFASAPLLSHPVEWIGGGYDLFATAGVLFAVRAVIIGRAWQAAFGTLLALLSKEVGVVTVGVAFCAMAAIHGTPCSTDRIRDCIRKLRPIIAVTAFIAIVRIIQVTSIDDPFAGRSIQPDIGSFIAACPAALGFAGFAPLADVLGQQEPTGMDTLGFILFAILIGVIAATRAWKTSGWLLLAAAGSLVPVSLISLGLEDMLQNPRYLYLSTALLAPVIPLSLKSRTSISRVVVGSLILISIWTGFDRTLKSRAVTSAVKPVASRVLEAPDGSRVWVYSGFYDEPTARLLMSQWLVTRRGIRAGYVMRGQNKVFVRLGEAQTDAAQAYFKPLALRVRPAESDIRILQILGEEPTAERMPPAQIATRTPAAHAQWDVINPDWSPVPPLDTDDPLPVISGSTLESHHFLGPVASAELHPTGAFSVAGTISGLELTLSVTSNAPIRYASGYHETYGAIFLGPDWSPRQAISFELKTDTEELQTIRLEWDTDDLLQSEPTTVGILPLNYRGSVRVEGIRIRR